MLDRYSTERNRASVARGVCDVYKQDENCCLCAFGDDTKDPKKRTVDRLRDAGGPGRAFAKRGALLARIGRGALPIGHYSTS